jgi:hypothetical protein
VKTAALERVIGRAGPFVGRRSSETCALCTLDLREGHPHLLDTDQLQPLCVCRACAVLFDRATDSQGRYRRIPDRRVQLTGVTPADLGVPVGLAFFVVSGQGDVRAHYPSPAGATRWEVDRPDWERAIVGCPALAGLAAEVEALLLNSTHDRTEAWIVPVTDCYRLVAVVRQTWQGLSGGTRVWEEIEKLFDELRRSDGKDTRR